MIKLLCAHIMFLIIDNKINCQYFSAKYRFLWIINAFAAWHSYRKNCFPLIYIFRDRSVWFRTLGRRSFVSRSILMIFLFVGFHWKGVTRVHWAPTLLSCPKRWWASNIRRKRYEILGINFRLFEEGKNWSFNRHIFDELQFVHVLVSLFFSPSSIIINSLRCWVKHILPEFYQ